MTKLRIRCLVPFCKHTIGQRKGDDEPLTETTQWICREHWKPVPKKMRVAYSRAWNWERGKPYRRKGPPKGRDHSEAGWRLWRRITRIAIERAMGL